MIEAGLESLIQFLDICGKLSNQTFTELEAGVVQNIVRVDRLGIWFQDFIDCPYGVSFCNQYNKLNSIFKELIYSYTRRLQDFCNENEVDYNKYKIIECNNFQTSFRYKDLVSYALEGITSNELASNLMGFHSADINNKTGLLNNFNKNKDLISSYQNIVSMYLNGMIVGLECVSELYSLVLKTQNNSLFKGSLTSQMGLNPNEGMNQITVVNLSKVLVEDRLVTSVLKEIIQDQCTKFTTAYNCTYKQQELTTLFKNLLESIHKIEKSFVLYPDKKEPFESVKLVVSILRDKFSKEPYKLYCINKVDSIVHNLQNTATLENKRFYVDSTVERLKNILIKDVCSRFLQSTNIEVICCILYYILSTYTIQPNLLVLKYPTSEIKTVRPLEDLMGLYNTLKQNPINNLILKYNGLININNRIYLSLGDNNSSPTRIQNFVVYYNTLA